MGVIANVFELGTSCDMAKTLGNIVISGIDNIGRNNAITDLIQSSVISNRTLVVIQDAITGDQHAQLMSAVSSHSGTRKVYDICISTSKASDILSSFNSAEDKANFILYLLGLIAEISESNKNKIYRLFFYLIDTLDRLSKEYKLKDLLSTDIEYITDLVNSSSIDDFEKNRRLRFLGDATTYSGFLDIESYIIQLETSGIVDTYSGDIDMGEMFSSGNIVLVSGYASEDVRKREVLIHSMSYALNSCVEHLCLLGPVSIIVKNADFINVNIAKALCEYNSSYNFEISFIIDDISRYIEKNGNVVLDRINSFLIFTQGSGSNAEFWSAFFGNRDAQEKSYSYTQKKSINPFGNTWDSGGVIASPRKYNSTTANYQTVNKPIYRPEIFRELKSDELMCYRREPFMRRKCRIGG